MGEVYRDKAGPWKVPWGWWRVGGDPYGEGMELCREFAGGITYKGAVLLMSISFMIKRQLYQHMLTPLWGGSGAEDRGGSEGPCGGWGQLGPLRGVTWGIFFRSIHKVTYSNL